MATPQTVSSTQVVSLLNKRRFLVQWATNPEVDIASYNIYRSENQFDGFLKVGSVGLPSTQFIDTVPFTFGVNFFWKVSAVNSSSEESDISDTEAVADISIGQFDEEPFKQVTVQKTDLVFNELAGGVKNGVNLVFITANLFREGTLQVFLNGQLQAPTVDFVEGTNLNSFTFVLPTVPISTDLLSVNYIKFF